MEKEFEEWYNDNQNRFHYSQFTVKEIAYSSWLEGRKRQVKRDLKETGKAPIICQTKQ